MIKSKIYSYCLILSTIVLGLNAGSGLAQNLKNPQEIEAKRFITSANNLEKAIHVEVQKFTNNFKDLQLMPPSKAYQYKLNISNNGNLVQIIAIPSKMTGLKTFTGALSFNNKSFAYNSILCKSENSAQVIAGEIKLVQDRLKCPIGFKIAFYNTEKEAFNSIEASNRAQQAYLVETQNFTIDQSKLGYVPSNTYYDYKIELLEAGKLAQTIATPKFNNLKSYIGGIFFEKSTGMFKSITCASEQPSNNIPQSIKLSDGKLLCPTEFTTTEPNPKPYP